jgi:hypothetical protein
VNAAIALSDTQILFVMDNALYQVDTRTETVTPRENRLDAVYELHRNQQGDILFIEVQHRHDAILHIWYANGTRAVVPIAMPVYGDIDWWKPQRS